VCQETAEIDWWIDNAIAKWLPTVEGWLLLGRQDRQGLRVIALECRLGHVPFKRYRGAWSSLDIAQALSVNRCSANFHGSSRQDEKEQERQIRVVFR
jgi:hypothetical protein